MQSKDTDLCSQVGEDLHSLVEEDIPRTLVDHSTVAAVDISEDPCVRGSLDSSDDCSLLPQEIPASVDDCSSRVANGAFENRAVEKHHFLQRGVFHRGVSEDGIHQRLSSHLLDRESLFDHQFCWHAWEFALAQSPFRHSRVPQIGWQLLQTQQRQPQCPK